MQQLNRRAAPLALVVLIVGTYTLVEAPNGLDRTFAIDLIIAIVAALILWPRVRWLLPGIVPVLVAAVLGLLANETEASAAAVVLPAAIGLGLLVLLAAGVEVGRYVDSVLHVLGRGVELAVGAVAFCVLIVPAWAWTSLRRRNPLVARGAPGPSWTDHAVASAAPASLASSPEVVGSRRTLTGRLTWAVGCLTLVVVANFAVGWAWDRRDSTGPAGPAASAQVDTSPRPRDPRNDLPAMAAYPWRERYFDDIQRTPGGYWPFTESRPEDFTSPYVNQDGWRRKTSTPKGDPTSMPTAWMFGGSTTWGEGQRDGYTIASWVARLSEQDGVPLRVANYGQRGWTHFQEMILFEQRLALEEDPDLAIFYDGANEITAQSLLYQAAPAHTLAEQYARTLVGKTIATRISASGPAPVSVGQIAAAYKEHSAIHKLVAYLRSEPAGASSNAPDDDPATNGGPTPAPGGGQIYDLTPQDGTDAGKVYERGKAITLMLSRTHHVQPFLFWQPVGYKGEPERRAEAELTAPTIDISDSLADHPEVFIDGGHTNEEGARIVAVEIWKHLEPAVRAWYKANR